MTGCNVFKFTRVNIAKRRIHNLHVAEFWLHCRSGVQVSKWVFKWTDHPSWGGHQSLVPSYQLKNLQKDSYNKATQLHRPVCQFFHLRRPPEDQGWSGPQATVGQPSTSTHDPDSRNLQLAAWHMKRRVLVMMFSKGHASLPTWCA